MAKETPWGASKVIAVSVEDFAPLPHRQIPSPNPAQRAKNWGDIVAHNVASVNEVV